MSLYALQKLIREINRNPAIRTRFMEAPEALLAATVVANCGYAGMLAAFFFFNQPVNRAVALWTPTSLPSDWIVYRARWETGHAIAAVLAVVSLVALIWAYVREKGGRTVPDARGS